MRDGASRILGYAIVASLLLHALVFYVLPAARELSALLPPEPEPLVARLEQLEPPPPAPAPVAKPAARKPSPAPRVVASPAPRQSAPAAAAPVAPAPLWAPQPEPAPAPAPAPPPPPPVAVAPSPDAGAVARYRRSLLDLARRDKRYPRVAIDNAWQGEVAVQISVGADGRIAALRVTRSSGHAVLDGEALRLFENAKSRVPIPRELRGQAFEIEVEVLYDLKDQRSGWNTTT